MQGANNPGWLSPYSAQATGSTTEKLEFGSRQGQNIFSSFLYSVKTESGADPAGSIQWVPGCSPQGVKLTTHVHLVPIL
jgi:hypothetical protein